VRDGIIVPFFLEANVEQKNIPTLEINDELIDQPALVELEMPETAHVANPQQKDITTLKINGTSTADVPTKIFGSSRSIQLDKKWLERFAQAMLALFCLVLVFFILSSLLPEFFERFSDRLKAASEQYWPNLIAVVVIIVLGFNLYILRGYKRVWFGIGEILFGIGIGWYAINKAFADSVADAIVILFAALYLVGRGWVNIAYRVRGLQIEQAHDDD